MTLAGLLTTLPMPHCICLYLCQLKTIRYVFVFWAVCFLIWALCYSSCDSNHNVFPKTNNVFHICYLLVSGLLLYVLMWSYSVIYFRLIMIVVKCVNIHYFVYFIGVYYTSLHSKLGKYILLWNISVCWSIFSHCYFTCYNCWKLLGLQ